MSTDAPTGFMARLHRRRDLWWGRPFRYLRPRAWLDELERRREAHRWLRAEDPDEVWRAGRHWQRRLIHKWNGRELAKKLGVRVPALYWHGQRPWEAPLESFPGPYVVKPVLGRVGRGVHAIVGAHDVKHDRPASVEQLRAALRGLPREMRRSGFLIEELVPDEGREYPLPLEYKVHMVGDTVAAISCTEGRGRTSGRHRFYEPSWRPFDDPFNTAKPISAVREPPHCLEEIVAAARRFGAYVGTYIRADFFSTPQGCVFNELASTPGIGKSEFTPFADAYLGRLWQEHLGDTV